MCASMKRRWTMTSNIIQEFTHQPCRVHIDCQTSAVVWPYWLGNIGCGLCASVKRHQPMDKSNNQCLHASAVVCDYRFGGIDRSRRASSRRHQLMIDNTSQGLHASAMVCAHRLSDIVRDLYAFLDDFCQWQDASAKFFTYLKSHVRIRQATLAFLCQPNPTNGFRRVHACII